MKSLESEDLEVSVERPHPLPRGMHVPDMSGYVRVTHKPTGLWAESETERSQLQNFARALQILGEKVNPGGSEQ
jgi:protein subunit release factor A